MTVRPNILLIYTDQQRFDTIGALGNPLIHTPHLDRLVREGHSFTHIRMIRTHDWKFVQDGEAGELYDLARDPNELVNRCGHPDCRDVESRLRSDLEAWKRGLKPEA